MKGILWAVLIDPLSVPQRYPNGAPHHITLRHNTRRWLWRGLEGLEFQATMYRLAWNDRAAARNGNRVQALQVKLPWWVRLLCRNRYPHITVSWVDGAKPVESNQMLQQPPHRLRWERSVRCSIQFHPHP